MAIYDLYRYQLLPAPELQGNLFEGRELTSDELRSQKNILFFNALNEISDFSHRGFETTKKPLFRTDEVVIFKIGIQKTVDRDTKELTKEKVESWPNVTVIVDNSPDIQVIAVSRNPRAFSSTRVLIEHLSRVIGSRLKVKGLTIEIREQFNSADFWSVVNENEGKVQRIRFEMVSPNMANISGSLEVDLRGLNRDTHAQRVDIELNAPPGSALEVETSNPLINGCVDYASNGGGDIAVKIQGLRKEIRTSTTVKTIEVENLEIQGDPEQVSLEIRMLFQ
jgi:hypothetical protein